MAAILDFGRTNPMPDAEDIGARRALAEAAITGPLAEGTRATEAPLAGRPALWIRPMAAAGGTERIVLYLHGGAFEVCSPTAYRAFCSSLALLLDATVVVPDYRLAPEDPFPAALEDVVADYRALLDLGHQPANVVVMGDSAGGGLMLSCLIAAGRDGLPQPAAAVGLSSWTDLTLGTDAHRRNETSDPFIRTTMLRRAAAHYLVDTDPRDPLASPFHASPEDLRGLAPILLQAAANEVLADDSSILAERIGAAGGDVTLELCPEAFHVWPMAGSGVPESRAALDSINRFVRRHLDMSAAAGHTRREDGA
jgi:monoterpene epsilon-lactone hydrolase